VKILEEKPKNVSTTIDRLTYWKIHEIAFDRDMRLKDILRQILAEYAEKNYKAGAEPT
jgi:hypothetical protein